MVIVTEAFLRPHCEKFTAICTIDENFITVITVPIGYHSFFTFLLKSEANQYSKQPLEKYCSHEQVSSFQKRECHHHHLILSQKYLIFVH